MRPLKQNVSITLDQNIIERLRILSEDCDRSLSQYINLVLKDHIKQIDAEQQPENKNK